MGYEQNYKVRSGTPEELHNMFCDEVHLKIGKAHGKRKSRMRKLKKWEPSDRDDKLLRHTLRRVRYCLETGTVLYEDVIERDPEKMLVY